MTNPLSQVMNLIDAANACDPNQEVDTNGKRIAKEVLYSIRMSECLDEFAPDASDLLKIAARAQHIERWRSPRSDFPTGPIGYKQWRMNLNRYHADRTGELMQQAGYNDTEIAHVKQLLLKKGLKTNADVQTLEDVVCMVFLKHYFGAFAEKHSENKVIDIVRKTWNKMSPKGHNAALALKYTKPIETLLQQALAANG